MCNAEDRRPDLFSVPTISQFLCRCPKIPCRGSLPVEHQNAGPGGHDPRVESGDIKVLVAEIEVPTAGMFGKVCQSDTELEQKPEVSGSQQPRRQAGRRQNRPEPIAWMGIVRPGLAGLMGSRGSADDQIKTGAEKIGENSVGQ